MMKNGDNETRTAADIHKDLTELLRQRAERESAAAVAERGIAVESLQAFRKVSGAEKRRKEHQSAHAAALEELEHIALVETALQIELEALERAESEADRKEHAREARKQADELAHVFRALDRTVKALTTAFRDARELVDQVRQAGYFATSREHADILMGDALNSGLQGLNFDKFKVPFVEPMRRRSFGEIGDRWATAMRGKADQVIASPPSAPPAPPPASSVLPPAQQSPASIEAKPHKRGDLSKSLPGDMALGGFRVYANKAEADAAHEAAKQGPGRA
jgi:hypothetical protein